MTVIKWIIEHWRGIAIFLAIALVIAGALWASHRISDLEDQTVQLTNDLADRDSLRKVLSITQGANRDLYERHARLEDDLTASLGREDALRRHVKAKDGTILSLTQTVSELRLENLRIQGLKTSETDATFTTLPNNYYRIEAGVSWLDPPVLTVVELSVWDSVWIANFRTDDDYYYGAIAHTNPHIKYRDATFRIQREVAMADATGFSFLRYRGPWATGRWDFLLGQEVAAGVGLEILGVQTSPYVKLEHRDKNFVPGAGIELRVGGN